MKKTDQVYLQDMLDMISKIDGFTAGMSFDQFKKDDKTQFATFHALEIIGEAANKLSDDFRESNLDFPVRKAVELRNILIHGYDLIRLDIVWKTIEDHLPLLKDQIEFSLES